MDQSVVDAKIKEADDLRNSVELATSVSDKHLDLLRPSARHYSIFKGQALDAEDRDKGKYNLVRDPEDFQQGIYDKPLQCFGCGIGWFSFLLGFLCPVMWFYATILYIGNHYRKDPRERAGLAASAIAALTFSLALLVMVAIILFRLWQLQFQLYR
ncbi:60S ribosomal protein L18a-like protein [Quillaja saponaria]|uniref:60S ribosomal protein L18a-like protein n=1 Tax=Quillaja saponaria TaxID=32244 RepID=A0AAD7QD95_QUISA|nr:60S ribosomal protein L18a-like protein [Quillaja saponaria]KAJ7979297.1 60S ribosomal protein L18a-like protein [Quillaja saponaria]